MNKILKTFLLILTSSFLFSKALMASDFCNGFERGYISGYKQSSGSGFDPFPPFCPTQPFKSASDPQSDYEHGYTVGYQRGQSEGRR